jgi:hypothetical protein
VRVWGILSKNAVKGGEGKSLCEPVTLVTPLDAAEPQTLESAPQLQDIVVTAKPDLSDNRIQEWEELIER